MQYRGALTIPAGTSAADPTALELAVCYGRLKRYSVYFPPGQAGTTFLQVFYRGRQILPTTIGASFRGDDLLIDLPDDYPLFDAPYVLTLYGWSPDATYDHTVYTLFYVEVPQVYIPVPIESVRVAVPELEE